MASNHRLLHAPDKVLIVGRPDASEAIVASLEELIGRYLPASAILARLVARGEDDDLSNALAGTESDLIVCVGGDGTLLRLTNAMYRRQIPLLGINTGRLGFLASVQPDEIAEVVDEVFAGKCSVEPRMAFEVSKDGDTWHSMNEVVVDSGAIARMVRIDIEQRGGVDFNVMADGLIVATPTGSSAYALSAGGPLLDPRLEAAVVVPMFPQALNAKPAVVEMSSPIHLSARDRLERAQVQLTVDGRVVAMLGSEDVVVVQKAKQPTLLVHRMGGEHFFAAAKRKLAWNAELPTIR